MEILQDEILKLLFWGLMKLITILPVLQYKILRLGKYILLTSLDIRKYLFITFKLSKKNNKRKLFSLYKMSVFVMFDKYVFW